MDQAKKDTSMESLAPSQSLGKDHEQLSDSGDVDNVAKTGANQTAAAK